MQHPTEPRAGLETPTSPGLLSKGAGEAFSRVRVTPVYRVRNRSLAPRGPIPPAARKSRENRLPLGTDGASLRSERCGRGRCFCLHSATVMAEGDPSGGCPSVSTPT